MLAANSKYRSIVTQRANQEFKPTKISSLTKIARADVNFKAKGDALWQPKKSSVSWAKLIMKIYEVDPLKCEECGEPMEIIAYITNTTGIDKILSHIGESSEQPQMHSARGPRDECCYEEGDARLPDEYDQTISW